MATHHVIPHLAVLFCCESSVATQAKIKDARDFCFEMIGMFSWREGMRASIGDQACLPIAPVAAALSLKHLLDLCFLLIHKIDQVLDASRSGGASSTGRRLNVLNFVLLIICWTEPPVLLEDPIEEDD